MQRLASSLVAVLTVSSVAFAQSPADVAAWLTSVNAKLNSKEPTAELVAKATRLDLSGVKDKLVPADLAKLKGMPLRDIDLGGKAGNDATVAELVKAQPNLEMLNLGSSSITDAALVEVAKLTRLRDLALYKTPITGAAMVSVAKIASLKKLDLSDTKVGDEGLEALKTSSIDNLWFNHMKGVTKKGVAALAAMPKLNKLVLQWAEINAEVEELVKSKTLKEITFMNSTLDDVGAAHLAKLKTLENLFLWSTKVTDKTMEAISGLPLKVLYISRTTVGDAGLKSLAKIKTLETLWIDHTPSTDAGLASFANHPTLRWLQADETKVTDACVATLITLPKLETFTAKKSAVTDAAVGKLKEKFPKGRFLR